MSPRPQRPALTLLPAPLRSAIERAGYYPQLVCDVIGAALADEEVRAHLVHQDTTFDPGFHQQEFDGILNGIWRQQLQATTESVPLSLVRGIMLTHVVPNPRAYRPGSLGREITLTVGWGTVNRVDLLPASCGDPNCGADHGFEGTIASDDLVLRISADADGSDKLTEAMAFAHALSASVGS